MGTSGSACGTDRVDTTDTIRPELTVLHGAQKDRVLQRVRRTRPRCCACGEEYFVVGDALFLGFLFLDEEQDAYMVALTCTNPACPVPHSGITLHGSAFLAE